MHLVTRKVGVDMVVMHMIYNQGLPYRAEPPGTGRTEPDRSLTDPVRACFSENDPEPHRTIRFGTVPAHTAQNRAV